MDEHPAGSFIAIAALMLLNAFVNAAQSALANVDEENIQKEAEEGKKGAKRVLKLLENEKITNHVFDVLICTTNLISGLIIALAYAGIIKDFIYNEILGGVYMPVTYLLLVLFYAVLIFLLVLLFVRVPKKLAVKHADGFCMKMSSLITFVCTLLTPYVKLMKLATRFILFVMAVKPEEVEENVTEYEIKSILSEGQEQGILEAEEAEMISNIFEFDDKEVKDIMTHRKKIIGVNADMSVEEALKYMLEENYSRFPLYKNDIDEIIGVLHIKDVMEAYMEAGDKNISLADIASEPYFVPDTRNINELLQEMQLKKNHIAFVVDEYGQTAGLVAMEDIIEEIVGDIQDEYDEEEEQISKVDDMTYTVKGIMSLDEIIDITGLKVTEEDRESFDTLNGLLISLLDHIPVDGETASFIYGGFELEILETSSRVIQLVKMTRQPEESDSDESEAEEDTSEE